MRGRGGFIGANVTPASAAINSAASGVWNLREAEGLKRAGTWPSSPQPPAAPTGLTATAGNAQVALSWTAPADNGGSAITDYVVQFSSNGGSTWNTFADGTSTATSATVTGLTNGTAYVFRVAAVNAVGTGAYTAASGSVTPTASVTVEYLVVAGGGGGGGHGGGGGGAGGMLEGTQTLIPGTSYAVTVGNGGSAGNISTKTRGGNGQNSLLGSFATAIGGGGGGCRDGTVAGLSGGSGGGGGSDNGSGGVGTAVQGNNGANAGSQRGGGGGGAGGAASGRTGGAGKSSSITGSAVVYAQGGQGGAFAGADGNPVDVSGASGSGYGAGGGGNGIDGQGALPGARGVVIIRAPAAASSTTGSPSVITQGADTVYTFTSSGSITF